MITAFEKWLETNEQRLRRGGVRVEVKTPIPTSAAVNAVLETESRIASQTAWDTGAFDIDVLSNESEGNNFAKRYDFQDAAEIIPILETISNQLIANEEVKL